MSKDKLLSLSEVKKMMPNHFKMKLSQIDKEIAQAALNGNNYVSYNISKTISPNVNPKAVITNLENRNFRVSYVVLNKETDDEIYQIRIEWS